MFSISAKGAYGLYALIELAQVPKGESLQIKDIAERQNLPQHYLEQLLVVLRKAGFVKSFRGTNGGYALASDPGVLKVSQILSALEGPVEIIREQVPRGGLEFFWSRLEHSINNSLDLSLEDLVQEKLRSRSNFNYMI